MKLSSPIACVDPSTTRPSPPAPCACLTHRRGFLGGLLATPALIGATRTTRAQNAPQGLIDVHAHLTPPRFKEVLGAQDLLPPSQLNWTPEKHIEDMDKAGVAAAMLSITTPGVWLGDKDKARALARSCNEYGAELASRHKGRFGNFAVTPLPDVEGALREVEYGLDKLGMEGVALFTNHDGKWLGDPVFDPLFAELDRRKAVVYVHPIAAPCCSNVFPWLRDSTIEYGTDTTRAIVSYVFLGAARRFPNVTMIWSHAGGTMPFLIERLDKDQNVANVKPNMPDGFRAEARKFFYDVAQASNPVAMTALKQVIPPGQIVFGTDFPYRGAKEHVDALIAGGVFTAAELEGVWRGNARRVLPRWAR